MSGALPRIVVVTERCSYDALTTLVSGRERLARTEEPSMAANDLTQTGITGLDRIFLGGIPRGNLILVEGGPGAGKTLMGIEFIYRGATSFDEPGIIVVFETSPEKLMRQALGFGWNLEELQLQKKLKIISTSPEIFDQELRSPDSLLLETAG